VVARAIETEEIIVPFPCAREKIVPPTHVRSTLVASSLRALRERRLFDAYTAALDPEWKNAILESVAGVWLPMEAGLAHYRACNTLPLSLLEVVAMGREVGDRINTTFLGTMIRAAKGAGVTPWAGFPYALKLYERLFNGGACSVGKIGPKDARMEVAGNPMVSISYFRNAMRGVWQGGIELFCQKAYVTELARTETSYKVKISWA
jgi:hypothetical protein